MKGILYDVKVAIEDLTRRISDQFNLTDAIM